LNWFRAGQKIFIHETGCRLKCSTGQSGENLFTGEACLTHIKPDA
jgi:hypothetical protein